MLVTDKEASPLSAVYSNRLQTREEVWTKEKTKNINLQNVEACCWKST